MDDICRDIKSKEKAVNLLFLTQGTLIANVGMSSIHTENNLQGQDKVSDYGAHTETSEGLHYAAALVVYSRNRFIVNLLPLLQNATALRRVVSVFTTTKEGPIDTTNFQGWRLPLMAQRGHASSIVTLSLEALAKKAPDVSFIHNFPGAVRSGIGRGTNGGIMSIVKAVYKLIGPLVYIPTIEAGERHVFLATSARYPAGTNGDAASGVPLAGGVVISRGTNGKSGSGVYSVDWDGESAGPKVEELLADFRKEGMVEKVWKHTEDEFKRITGVEAA